MSIMKTKSLIAAVSTLIFTGVNLAFSQNAPSPIDITKAVKQDDNAVSNLRMRSVIVSVASDGFFGSKVKAAVPSINGKIIDVTGEAIIFDRPNLVIDRNQIRVADRGRFLTLREKFYHSSSGQDVHSILQNQVTDKDGSIVETVSNNYRGASALPTNTLVYAQVQFNDEQNDTTSLEGMTLTGEQNYMGLKCFKFSWGEPNKSATWGFKLVAPERSYRIVYSEAHAHSPGLTLDDKMSVVAFIHSGNLWIPSQIKTETNRVDPDKVSNNLITVTKVFEVHTDDVSEDLLFDPMLSPGESLLETEPGLPVIRIGGNLSLLASELQKGDFSFLDSPTKPLSTP